MQFKSSHNKQEFISSIETSNIRTIGAKALAVTLGLLWNLIMTRPQTTSQAQVKLILSLSTLITHAMDERNKDS